MLLSFSVSNFRSFDAEQSFELLANLRHEPKPSEKTCVDVPGTDQRVVRVASVYGANGAGKSNLIKGLRFVQRRILEGRDAGQRIPYQPFRLSARTRNEPSRFELQFLAGGEVYCYGFACDAERVHEEWLDAYEGARARSVFQRTTDAENVVEINLGPGAEPVSGTKLRALVELGVRPNQLFLTEVKNLGSSEAQGSRLSAVLDWFETRLIIISPGAQYNDLYGRLYRDQDFAEFVNRFLEASGTGIAQIEVSRTEIPRSQILGESKLAVLLENIVEGESATLKGPGDTEFVLDPEHPQSVFLQEVKAVHDCDDGTKTKLPLYDESDGSRRLLHLLPAFHSLKDEPQVFVIDELERSMHPLLARKLIEYFLKESSSTANQLLFTTHESTLLDLDLFRRDGIWFTERDSAGATHLYSLVDFNVRKDLRIEKGYLQGRFGAIPFLGGFDHLLEQGPSSACKPEGDS